MKGLYGQLVATVERLPTYVKELVKNGVKVPLGTWNFYQESIKFFSFCHFKGVTKTQFADY